MRKVGLFVVLITLTTSSISTQTGVHPGSAFTDFGTTYFRYDTNKIVVVYKGERDILIGIRTYYPNSEYLDHGMFALWEQLPDMELTVAYRENAPKQSVLAKFGAMIHEEQYDVPGYFCVTSLYSLPDDWHYNTIVLWDESGKLVYSGPLNR